MTENDWFAASLVMLALAVFIIDLIRGKLMKAQRHSDYTVDKDIRRWAIIRFVSLLGSFFALVVILYVAAKSVGAA
jgi:hypothetical protein